MIPIRRDVLLEVKKEAEGLPHKVGYKTLLRLCFRSMSCRELREARDFPDPGPRSISLEGFVDDYVALCLTPAERKEYKAELHKYEELARTAGPPLPSAIARSSKEGKLETQADSKAHIKTECEHFSSTIADLLSGIKPPKELVLRTEPEEAAGNQTDWFERLGDLPKPKDELREADGEMYNDSTRQ